MQNILIYNIECVRRIKDLKYVKVNSINLLCFTINKVNQYFQEIKEINKNKYLTLVSAKEKN